MSFFGTTQLCTLGVLVQFVNIVLLAICVMQFSPLYYKVLVGLVYFHIFKSLFPSVILDFKHLAKIFLIRWFQLKTLSLNLIRKLTNLEVRTFYSKDFSRVFWSNLTDLQNNLFRANFKKLFKFNKIIYIFFNYKSSINLQSHSNHDIAFNCDFRYSLDYI